MEDLLRWRDSPRRMPLVLNGARQVGKTWILKELGRTAFEDVAYVNLDNNQPMWEQFGMGYDLGRLVNAISAQAGCRVVPGRTLVILDEVQECPKALTSLKYFCEEIPELAVAVAGSLLGTTFHEGTGFPVGKVDMLDLRPLSFHEFLSATGYGSLREVLRKGDPTLAKSVAPQLEGLVRLYWFVGGMPRAVSTWVHDRDPASVRSVQDAILYGYERDVSKHLSASEAEHALAAWRSIPAHLSRENKRFVFGHIKEGARARDYRSAITWLTHAGITTCVPRVSEPGIPLSAYANESIFKLFLVDVGLLGAMADIDPASIVAGGDGFREFKGAMAEQYVCQELLSQGLTPYYWAADRAEAEIDFLVQRGGVTYPIEVKSGGNVMGKSLASFNRRYGGDHARRFSMLGYRDQDWVVNVPLYAVGETDWWVSRSPSFEEVLKSVVGKAVGGSVMPGDRGIKPLGDEGHVANRI